MDQNINNSCPWVIFICLFTNFYILRIFKFHNKRRTLVFKCIFKTTQIESQMTEAGHFVFKNPFPLLLITLPLSTDKKTKTCCTVQYLFLQLLKIGNN